MKKFPSLLLSIFLLLGCGGQSFKQITSGVLTSTGYVSQGEADALVNAGDAVVKAATPLTEEQEYYLGRSVAATVLGRFSTAPDANTQHYVNVVGRTLAGYSDRPALFAGYHFLVIQSPELNALSTPGGYVFVTSKFLQELKSEDELAAVLAHEIGHIVRGHGVSAISQSNLTKAVTLLGKAELESRANGNIAAVTGIFGDSVNQVVDTLLVSGYSRSKEYEADAYAHTLLVRAGYDPKALVQVLKTIEAGKKGAQSSGWYKTHPDPDDRISKLEDMKTPSNAAATGMAVRTARFMRGVHVSAH